MDYRAGLHIDSKAHIAKNATVVGDVTVGPDVTVLEGAGSLVTGTADIPDGWMAFGSPAKPIRPLRDDELASLVDAAEEYREIGHNMESQGFLLPGSEYSPI